MAESATPGEPGGGPMRGLRGIVLGVANSRSIAFGIAKAARAAGAELAMTYQGEALKSACARWPPSLARMCWAIAT